MADAQTHTLDVPGARLAYDVRPADGGGDGAPPLMLIGSPMDARGFAALAARFPDRTVVTYDPLVLQNMVSGNHYEYDMAALRRAATRIVVGVGAETAGTLARRGGEAVAECLATRAVVFPSHHAGFAGGEFGIEGRPDEFAATLAR